MKTKKTIRFIPAFITAFVLCTTVAFAQKPYTLDDLDQFTKVERLSERVLIVSNGVTDMDRVTAIATKKGIVVIDAGTNAPRTVRYRAIIEKEFKRNDFVYLINTHSHQDHTFGNRAFKGAVVIGHEKIKEELTNNVKENYYTKTFSDAIKQWQAQLKEAEENSNRWKQLRIYLYEGPEILSTIADNFRIPIPDISFNDEMELDMGDMTFKLKYFGEAHTQSDILVYVPEEKLLFVGDLFNYPGDVNFRFFGKGNSENWIKALEKILVPENDIEHVVNAHYSRTMGKNALMGFYANMQVFANGYKEGKEPYNSENLTEIEQKSGSKGLADEIKKLGTADKGKYFFFENTLNVTAYQLLGLNKMNEALEVFIFITQQFPDSWNAFDSLAEIYMAMGNKQLAIENYEKSLQMNPQNANASEQIKKLREKSQGEK